MKTPFLLLTIGLLSVAAAEDPAPESPEPATSVRRVPWVGLRISKLTPAVQAQASGIPKGVGFLVEAVDQGGPAAKAGMRPYDILWKLGDQLLVNEAQFATLLMMREPGEELPMTVRRSGEDHLLAVVASAAPEPGNDSVLSPAEVPLVPTGVPGMPRTIVYPQSRTAETSREDGSVARLHYEEGDAVVSIHDATGTVLYQGPVYRDGEWLLPKEWACSVGALMRVMRQSEDSDWKPRRPRPRVVTPDGSAGRDGRDWRSNRGERDDRDGRDWREQRDDRDGR